MTLLDFFHQLPSNVKELIGSAKAPHIYKGTKAQTQKPTFVKECCLQTLPKPLDTIKTIPFDKSACIQQGVWRYWGRTLLSSSLATWQLLFGQDKHR